LNGNNNLNNNGRFVGIVKQNCWDFIFFLFVSKLNFSQTRDKIYKTINHSREEEPPMAAKA
jgi:hypothetical protein